jgi:hypothetical protein
MDAESLVAGLLHDTVEDTDAVCFDDIEARFGTAVRRIVEGETKISKITKVNSSAGADQSGRKRGVAEGSEGQALKQKQPRAPGGGVQRRLGSLAGGVASAAGPSLHRRPLQACTHALHPRPFAR